MKHHLLFVTLFLLSRYALAQTTGSSLVIAGDYPDPSVAKIGDTYWASATSSNWFPAYPLLQSKDLVNWQTTGFVFEQKPDWADYYFWAPEISYENGRVYVYYSAHKKGGNLCVGIASADRPEGPYRDHGPLICQEVGSIDAFPMRDETGKLYLIWKEDANSVNKPTPIWAQALNEERTALIGERAELFRNDKPWEANLVEGVSMLRHGDYYYAFYAAAGCCGAACTYGTGVARSKNLLGPWEKYAANPVITADEAWKCPGHGTPIEKDGRFYFMYHAYSKQGDVYVGRQALLREFRFTNDGWVEFLAATPAAGTPVPPVVTDDISGSALSTAWNWSVFRQPQTQLQNGRLTLSAQPDKIGDFVGHRTLSANYKAQATVIPGSSSPATGLALIGDEDNSVGVAVAGSQVQVWKREKGMDQTLTNVRLPGSRPAKVYLRALVQNGKDITFAYSVNGKDFKTLNNQPINGAYLPPWDRAIRVGLTAKGSTTQKAVFDDFMLTQE